VYGYRKVREDLVQEQKLSVCRETVRSLMQDAGLRSKAKRKFVVTTDSNHTHPIAENLVARDFAASAPNEKWVADITYIRTREGWLYLAAVMDLFSRRIVGWSFSTHIDAALVCEALKSALLRRHPGSDLVHHSDRGAQYASLVFQDLLAVHGISCSMSRKGDPWDNACMESFFDKLKSECFGDNVFNTFAEAERELFWYIEVFYNRVRRHASLGYVSPATYEARAQTTRAA
jgi:transposase InsO family protein